MNSPWNVRLACDERVSASLWTKQGEDPKAQDLLAPLYAWFTEGFDTADPQRGEGAASQRRRPVLG
jgi:hypothetical protein